MDRSGVRGDGPPTPALPAAGPLARGPTDRESERDLQSLLAGSVQRLRELTGARAAVAWALHEDATPYVVAAAFEGEPPGAPDAAAFEAAGRLRGATDLADESVPEALRRLSEESGFTAAVPVLPGDGAPAAVLLLDTRRPLRPRQLAALDSAAERLRGPAATARSLQRLAALDLAVQRLDRLAALGTVASEIAHEVRNALVSVKTFLQLLPERRDDPELWERFPDLALDELRRTERLLDAIIEHGRPAEEGGGPPDVAAALESVVALVRHRARTRGVAVESELLPGLPPCALSEDALRQVVLNLLLNAIEATPAGGRVRLRASARQDGGIVVAVRDEGPGIPEERRRAIFEPFVTSRTGRAGGLGLAITRRLVLEAGGEIHIADTPTGSAELRIDLPEGTTYV